MIHTPVLLEEVLKYLAPKPSEFIIDGTVDGGGHGSEILRRVLPSGKLLGIDMDSSMIANVRKRISENIQVPISKFQAHLVLECGNYAGLPEILREKKLPKADGLLLDLGFSSEQLASSGRGFSFESDEPLMMTYDDAREPVSELLLKLGESELARILREYGEERYAKQITRAIAEREKEAPILTSYELAEVVRGAVPRGYERGRIHPATRTFQALRIYANDELGNLRRVLGELPDILKAGGRAVVITFHSLEDRIVKHAFRDMAQRGILEILTKKPITASEEELRRNPRSRSAKLRAAQISRGSMG
jgi:16S rRNA (cytosine1402-N4)-methyltransferase